MSGYESPPDVAASFATLARRIAALERTLGAPTIQQVEAAPTSTVRDGSAVVDTSSNRLWVRVNGAWRFVGLT
ncbi:MAG: hypothetical protein WKF96_22045 [Solirubrobacteraceae bacterium]